MAALVLLAGCQRADVPVVTSKAVPNAIPSPSITPTFVTCADLDRTWGDWQVAFAVLLQLEQTKQTCGIESLASKKYAVLMNWAGQLQGQNQVDAAIEKYRAALALDGQRQEALRALLRLNALPPPTPAPCAPQPLAPHVVSGNASFARTDANRIVIDNKPLVVRGINYYPRNAPWQGFIAGSDLSAIERELDLIAARGFNSLRIFLWYDALFQCEPERAEPNAAAFEKLDAIFDLARARDLRLIVTLTDLPDFYFRPVYTDWARYDAQTAFIVRRYREDPLILAWDVRNEGDIDYGITGNEMPNTTRAQVLAWLAHSAALVRTNDSNHLLTAGWLQAWLETEPFVDILSLHHWSSESGLADKIQTVHAATTKPLLVEEMGLAGMGEAGETAQAENLPRMVETVEHSSSAGWMIWTAFDFFALPDEMAATEYRFGLWRNNLAPKPVLDRLPLATRTP